MITAHAGDKFKLPSDRPGKGTLPSHNLREINDSPIYSNDLNKLRHVKCIESIQFSQFNPVSPQRQMQGDLFYIVVKTLENPSQEHVITCSVNGFFKNDSTEKGAFNPNPYSRGNPCFSYSLVGTLHQLSPLFSTNLQTLMNSILRTEPYFLTKCPPNNESWLVPQRPWPPVKVSNSDDLSQTLTPLYGLDTQNYRDWNDEMQNFKSFGRDTFW